MPFFPYTTIDAPARLSVRGLRLDDRRPSRDPVDAESRTVDLIATEPRHWRTATFEVVFSAPAGELDAVRAQTRELRVTLSIESRRTNYRASFELEPSPTDDSVWLGRGRVSREFCAGRVDVHAQLSGVLDGVEHQALGRSDRWEFYVDETEAPPRRGMLRFVWIDFTGEEAPAPVRQFENEIYYADMEHSGGPLVYLNSSIDGLHDLLTDRPNRELREQVLHETQVQAIAAPIWVGLFAAAATAVGLDSETSEPDGPPERWQSDVLRALLPKMYPTASESERLRKLHDDFRSEEGVKGVVSLAQAAAARQLQSATRLRRMVQRLARDAAAR